MKVSHHAVQRYIERVKPHLGAGQAKAELRALLAVGKQSREAPGWVHPGPDDFYVELSDGIVCPVRAGWVVTVLTRGGMDEEQRAYKNRKKSQRRHARRYRNRLYDKQHPRPDLPPDIAA